MARSSDDLVVRMAADIRRFERRLEDAGILASRKAREIEDRFEKMNPKLGANFLGGLLKGTAAGLSIDRLARSLAAANKELVGIDRTAKLVGVSTDRLQELRFAGGSVGIDGKTISAGVEKLAEQLNRARTEETELGKLFAANNLSLKDRQGQVIGVNEALTRGADLVRNAATEFDKIRIAELLGLSREWIPLLEQGGEAVNRIAAGAREAGGVIDAELIQRAKDFDKAWTEITTAFTLRFKSALAEVGSAISRFVDAELIKSGSVEAARRQIGELEKAYTNAIAAGGTDIAERFIKPQIDAARKLLAGQGEAPLIVSVRPPDARRTVLPGKPAGGGGGSGGMTDEEKRTAEVERYIKSLERTGRILEAESASLGKSNAERAKAIELARIGTVTDGAQLARIDALVVKNEAYRASIERVREAQEGANDAARFFGSAISDALSDLIFEGAKAEDVAKKLALSLAKAALQAALLGDGPLAGLFGTAGKDGAPGGVLGTIFASLLKAGVPGKARGGPVRKGQPYIVGENRPEVFVPGASGRIVPRVSPPPILSGRSGGSELNVVINSPPGVESTPSRDGSGGVTIDQFMRSVESRIADRNARGQGAMAASTRGVTARSNLRG